MKILIISWFYYPKTGGVETVARAIAEGIAKKGFEVDVLTSSDEDYYEKISDVGVFYSKQINPYFEIDESFETFFENLIRNKYDVIHTHNLTHPFNIQKSLSIIKIANKLNIPLIEHAHNAQLKTPEKTKEILEKDFSKIICVSNFVKEKIKEKGIDQKKLKVVYNGVDTERFSPKLVKKEDIIKERKNILKNEDKVIIFFPGRTVRISKVEIGEQKQFETVVKALNLLKSKKIKFKLIVPGFKSYPGSDGEKEILNKKCLADLIEKYELKEDILIFEESIPVEDMPLKYAAADIVCMPSIDETFGMVFVEAQAMGKPIVATKSGGALEIIENEKSGLLIEPKNYEELAICLERLINNKDLREKLGKEGKKNIEKKFTVKKLIGEMEKIYREFETKRIYLIRHPETKNNEGNLLTGWEETEYSDEGLKQFEKILKFVEGRSFKRVYSSDLSRALDLAKEIASKTKSELVITGLIRERNFKETAPKNSFETENEFRERIKKFVKENDLNEAVIVSHAGVKEELVRKFIGESAVKEMLVPRDIIFIIEINKKSKNLVKLEV
jgi:glycosyltransferase involved in cell wall biosynthesis/phosphohistidine phosphatase SixA